MKIISLRHSFIFHSRRFFPNYFSRMLWIFQRFQNRFSPDTDIVSSPSNPLLEVFSFFLDFVKTLHLEEFQKIRSFRSTPPWSNFHSKNPSANFVPNSSHYIRTSHHTLPDYLQPFFHIAFSVLFYRLLLATPMLCTRARLYPFSRAHHKSLFAPGKLGKAVSLSSKVRPNPFAVVLVSPFPGSLPSLFRSAVEVVEIFEWNPRKTDSRPAAKAAVPLHRSTDSELQIR